MVKLDDFYKIPSLPASFSGISKIKKHYKKKIPTKEIKEELAKLDSYTLHRESKRPRKYNPFYILKIRQQVQIDLIDVSQLAKYNDDIKFLLVGIDMFTKLVYCTGMKSKSADNSLQAIQQMIEFYTPPKPIELYSDHGTEFKNKKVQKYLQDSNISYRYPYSDLKCAGVERVNKTIQNKLYRYMTEHNTERYIDVLQDIITSYNNTKHRTILMEPFKAEDEKNHLWVRDKLLQFYNRGKKKKPNLKIGDIVRISSIKEKFSRGYNATHNTELFQIIDINTRMAIPMYLLKSLEKNDIVEGGFYESQLTQVKFADGDHKVDRILKTRMVNGKKQSLVKWIGRHDIHNSWIETPDLTST